MFPKRTRTALAVSILFTLSSSAPANDDEGYSCTTFALTAYETAKLRDSPQVKSIADARVYIRKIMRNSDKSEENKKYDRWLLNKAVEIAYEDIVDPPLLVAKKARKWCVATLQ
jgi:hypothetical protein